MELFVRAVRLGPVLADGSKIEIADVIRKDDFRGENIRLVVDFFLKHFDEKKGVSEALLVNKLSEVLFNGIQAEKFYLAMCDKVPAEPTIEVEVDMYKKTLYEVRCKNCSRDMLKLRELIANTDDPEKKKALTDKSEKLDMYYHKLQQKSAAL